MRAGFWEILLIVVLVLILFGHSKIPDLMRNLANGINIFKKELKGKDKAEGKKASVKSESAAPTKKPVARKKVAKKATKPKPVKK